MTPERGLRVSPEDVPYLVGDLARRLVAIEAETKDLGVLRYELTQLTQALKGCTEGLATTRRYVDEEVDKLRNAVTIAAVSLAGSAILVSATVYLAFK